MRKEDNSMAIYRYKALNVDVEFDREVLDKFDLIAVVSKSNQLHVSEMMPDIKEKVVYPDFK